MSGNARHGREPMVWNRRLSDRRGHLRFEIVGQLWGTLGAVEALPLRDISRGGALVESVVPLPAASIQTMRLILERNATEVQVRVCHLRSAVDGVGGTQYLIGLEFVSLPAAALEEIDRLVAGLLGPEPSQV